MQGDTSSVIFFFTVKTTVPNSPPFPPFSLIFLVFFLFLFFLSYYFSISTVCPTLTGLAVHTMPSAFGSHLFPSSEVLWF